MGVRPGGVNAGSQAVTGGHAQGNGKSGAPKRSVMAPALGVCVHRIPNVLCGLRRA